MAARKNLWHPDEIRKKIQASQLINRLQDHAISAKPLMDNSQVSAARLLLSKVLPDLSAVQLSGDKDSPLKHEVMIKFVGPDGEENLR